MPFAEPDLRGALRTVERFFLPPECLLCGEAVPVRDGDALVCSLCRSRWSPLPFPQCARCGQPLAAGLDCRGCTDWPEAFRRVRSAVWLDETARLAVHQLKYEGWWRVVEAMALAMRGLEPLTGDVFLVPVPLGARRARRRGYNQSERLATALACLAGVRVVPALARTRETPTQTRLAPDERRANVAGAFAARGLPGGTPVLVDDVFTTGATLVAAAEALMARGARQVDAVTFARARPPVA
ncbi:MAG: ComF family protein [Gemmatimonadota bacterium]